MEIKIVDEKGLPKEEKPNAPLESKYNVSFPVLPEIQNKAIAEVMGLETDSERSRYSDEIGTLLEFVKSQTRDLSPNNIKMILRNLEIKLGSPPLSEKKIHYITRYAYLLTSKESIDKEIKNLQGKSL